MSTNGNESFAAISRCIDQAGLAECDDTAQAAYRELWAARRLLETARLVTRGADWEADHYHDPPQAPVERHDLVLLEAALLVASGERAATPDGFPHGGSEVGPNGICDAGFCPCHDGQRPRQPSLLGRAA